MKDTTRGWMSAIRRFVIWALAIVAVGTCALLAPAVGGTGFDSVEQTPALIPGSNPGLRGITQATAGQGYVDYAKENDLSLLVELSLPRQGMRHLATVSETPAFSANLVAVPNLVGLRMPEATRIPQTASLALGAIGSRQPLSRFGQ